MTTATKRRRVTPEEDYETVIMRNYLNRKDMYDKYQEVETVEFYYYNGSVQRVGKVTQRTERCVTLQFRGYVENFFYEQLMDLEASGDIQAIKGAN